MTKERKIFLPLTSKDVCHVYESLLEKGLVSFPVTKESFHKIDSLVSTITNSFFGNEIYETPEEKAVAYFYFLIKDHPFTDGNKRTAVLAFLVLCYLNKLALNKEFSLDGVAVYIEKIRDENHHGVIKLLADILFESH